MRRRFREVREIKSEDVKENLPYPAPLPDDSAESFKDIKPESGITFEQSQEFWDKLCLESLPDKITLEEDDPDDPELNRLRHLESLPDEITLEYLEETDPDNPELDELRNL